MSRPTDPQGDQDEQSQREPPGETDPKSENDGNVAQDAENAENGENTENEIASKEPELHRVRPLALSERPTPTSGASVLSLANAHVAAGLADPGDGSTADAPPPAAAPKRSPSPSTPDPLASPPVDPVGDMRDRFSLGDYTGALAAAEVLLADFPEHTEARRCADNCRSVLEQMYAARIGPLDRIPHVAVPREKLQWLSIDHRAGFVLSHVDGVSSLQMIMAACGMPLLDVLRILHELVHSRVIAFR